MSQCSRYSRRLQDVAVLDQFGMDFQQCEVWIFKVTFVTEIGRAENPLKLR